MYPEFDYKLQKSTLISCTRWLAWRKKNRPNQIDKQVGHKEKKKCELLISFRKIF